MIPPRWTRTHSASTIALTRCQYHSSACVLTPVIGLPSALRAFASQLASKRGPRCESLQAGDPGGRLDVLRTALAARALRVAGVATCVTGDRPQSLALLSVAQVIDERPCSVERRR